MKSQFDETALSSFVDGELDIRTMREVEAFIETDDDARRYVLNAVKTAGFLRAAANETLHEQVPDRLVRTLEQRPIGRPLRKRGLPPFLRIAAAVLLVLFGFGGGTLLRSGGSQPPAPWEPLSARYSEVINETLEENLSGTSRQWHAPHTSTIVRVTPVKTYRDKNGRYYRQYHLEVRTGKQRRQLDALAYRTARGKWKTEALFLGKSDNSI